MWNGPINNVQNDIYNVTFQICSINQIIAYYYCNNTENKFVVLVCLTIVIEKIIIIQV